MIFLKILGTDLNKNTREKVDVWINLESKFYSEMQLTARFSKQLPSCKQ